MNSIGVSRIVDSMKAPEWKESTDKHSQRFGETDSIERLGKQTRGGGNLGWDDRGRIVNARAVER